MGDKIDLYETRLGVVPFSLGPHRNLRFQQRPWLGVGAAVREHRGPGALEHTIDRGVTHPH